MNFAADEKNKNMNRKLSRLTIFLILNIFILLTSSFAFAVDPPTNLEINSSVKVLAREFAQNTIHIPGGEYQEPYIIDQPDTEYILDGNIIADGDAILIRASRVVINLNDKIITYNQTVPGHGIRLDAYNKNDISIINGSIIQGKAMSEGDQYGAGNNPIRTLGTARLQIANINARYGGRDVGGFYAPYGGKSLFEHNKLEDTWTHGTFKNRHQGVSAIKGGENSIYRCNTIVNARHRGIEVKNNSEVYSNNISINSLATNSVGISGYKAENVNVYDNNVVGRGEHPIGIGFASKGTNNIHIYNNSIDVQTTKIGEEYGGNEDCFDPDTPCGNYAVGFRTTWGGDNIDFHDNEIIVRTDSRYNGTYSVTNEPVVVNAKGRGLMIATVDNESAEFYNNKILALDKDGTGKAFGIAVNGGSESPNLVFENNTVTSNILNVALSDAYGACEGFPLFMNNTFIKKDDYETYNTVRAELGGYFPASGRFVSNDYHQGASKDNIVINANSSTPKSVYFGREITVTLQTAESTPQPISGATINLSNALPTLNADDNIVPDVFALTAKTDSQGNAGLIVYDYELHNAKATQTEAIKRYLAPHNITVEIDGKLYEANQENANSSWDDIGSDGSYNLNLYNNGMLDNSKKLIVSIN